MAEAGEVDDGRGAFLTEALGAAARSGLEIMRSGMTNQPGIGRSLNFWLAGVGNGLKVFGGEPGMESLKPLGIIPWRLDAEGDRQRLRLRGDDGAGAERELHDAGDQGEHDTRDPAQLGHLSL